MRTFKKHLGKEKKKQFDDKDSIDKLLWDILEKSKIRKQSFHGGAMNGVLCRRLLDHLKVVFPKIGAMAHEQVTTCTFFTFNTSVWPWPLR